LNAQAKESPVAVAGETRREDAGVHAIQDALGDRMITLDLDQYDRETEIEIASARSGLSPDDAERIVDMVRGFRATGECAQTPTLRSSIQIARVAAGQQLRPLASDKHFVTICFDVLESKIGCAKERRESQRSLLVDLIERYCR
jgi:gas vesicle protein GvpN